MLLLLFLPQADLSAQVNTCNVPSEITQLNFALSNPNCAIINIGSGTFASNVIIDHNVEIRGAGIDTTILNGNGESVVIVIEAESVTITDLSITDGTGSFGGGIFIEAGAGLTLERISIVGNSASIQGGGIDNRGTLSMSDVQISANSSQFGGGIYSNALVSMRNVTLSANIAESLGGGMFIRSGELDLINVTIEKNVAVASSSAGDGGGIFINEGSLRLTHVTFHENSARIGGAILNFSGLITMKSSIIANSVSGGNCAGLFGSQGYNLSTDDSCTDSLTAQSDINAVDARLDPDGALDNGGLTPTIALLGGSPAIDAIPIEDCTDQAGSLVTDDQRGASRPQRSGCDIGALEVRV
jgi:hypothetical protein